MGKVTEGWIIREGKAYDEIYWPDADYRALQAKLAAMVVAMNEAIDGAIPEGCYLCINNLKAAIAAAEGGSEG